MIIFKSSWLSFAILLAATPLFARSPFSPIDKLREHAPVSMNTEDYPLFPVGEAIPDFPEPVDVGETDLAILAKYYNDLAMIYDAWRQANYQQSQKISKSLHHARHQLHTAHMRRAVSSSASRPTMIQNQYKAAMYQQGKEFADYQQIAQRSEAKAIYYRKFAKACEESHPENE